MAKTQVSPAQRAVNFAKATRQYEHELPSMKFSEGQTLSVTFPKTRFLSKVYLKVKGTFKATHASKTEFTPAPFDRYRLLRQIRLSINNGFNPYQISGVGLHLYNTMNRFNAPASDVFGLSKLGKIVSSSGTVNTVEFILELPITINDRESVGLIMLQNEQTNVTLNIDCGYFLDMMTDSDIGITLDNIQITPTLETFSVPENGDAVPDFSIIKLVNEQIESVVSVGDMIAKLPVGLTYRKMLIYIATDADYTPVTHANLSTFSHTFNQADTPYLVHADHVAYKNKRDYAGQLPLGCYAFDFSSQGLPNYGGSRDYIDTERFMEYWLKVNFATLTGSNNYVYIVSEKLARVM